MTDADLPAPGLVLHYAYLWRREQRQGHEDGEKERPCVVIDTESVSGSRLVAVVPITHTPPESPEEGLELPPDTKRRLGLDDQRSWIIVTEFNRFVWQGPDLRRTPDGRDSYGRLPHGQIGTLLQKVRTNARHGDLAMVKRTE